MTTPLQKAAQAVIDRWDSPAWKDQPHTAEYILALRKALDAELAQAVEPCKGLNCGSLSPKLHSAECFDEHEALAGCQRPFGYFHFVFDSDNGDYWRETDDESEMPLFTHPDPPPAGEQIDWQDMYRKMKSEKEAMAAKYEKDIGPLARVEPTTGERASLLRRADTSVAALDSRIMEPFYCALDQDASRVLSDCIDMLEADAQPKQVTCQIYGHVVGACVECNTHIEAQQAKPTGWDNGLSQDYCAEFGQWLASRSGARQQIKEMFEKDAT